MLQGQGRLLAALTTAMLVASDVHAQSRSRSEVTSMQSMADAVPPAQVTRDGSADLGAVVLLSIGFVAVHAGLFIGAAFLSELANLNASCPAHACADTTENHALFDHVTTLGTAANITVVVGLVALATGAGVWLAGRRARRAVPQARFGPMLLPGGFALAATGSF